MHQMSQSECRERLARGWQVVAQEGCLSDFARGEGISAPGAMQWLRRHSPELHRSLLDGRRRTGLSETENARRAPLVALIKLGKRSQVSVAQELGVTPAAISKWAKVHEDEVYEAMNQTDTPDIRRVA